MRLAVLLSFLAVIFSGCGPEAKKPTAREAFEATEKLLSVKYKDIKAEYIRVLISEGADVNARNTNSLTPLMIAAGGSSTPEIVQLLLEKGADALAKDEEGKKAIDHAQENEKLKGTPAYWKLHKKSFE